MWSPRTSWQKPQSSSTQANNNACPSNSPQTTPPNPNSESPTFTTSLLEPTQFKPSPKATHSSAKQFSFPQRNQYPPFINPQTTSIQIQLSKKLKKNFQIRVVLDWKNPNLNLNLYSAFVNKKNSECLIGYGAVDCGHVSTTLTQDNQQMLAQQITINKLKPYRYLFFVSQYITQTLAN